MSEYMQKIQTAADTVRQAVGEAEIGIILGSGLGDYVEALTDAQSIDYADIPGFPRSTVPGHKGRWVTGTLHGKRVCMMQGRFHAYEEYDLRDVTLPVRVMALLGVKTLIVTNAAGGVNLSFHPGDLMLITDCINFSGMNPLRGENLDAFGPRFPDMSQAYSRELIGLAERCAEEMGVSVQKGVYCWFNGPCFETPAEIRMARVLGADAVGMSTAVEATAARHCGMRVCGISCVCNKGAGLSPTPLTHEEVQAAADAAAPLFKRLVKESIVEMCKNI